MNYLGIRLVHRKGVPATYYIGGKEAGTFEGSKFTCTLSHTRDLMDPFPQEATQRILLSAASIFDRIPASLDEDYFSVMVMFWTDRHAEVYKNGVPVPDSPGGQFPYPMREVINPITLLEEETLPHPSTDDAVNRIQAQLTELLKTSQAIEIERLHACLRQIGLMPLVSEEKLRELALETKNSNQEALQALILAQLRLTAAADKETE